MRVGREERPAVFLDILKGHDYSILVNLSNMFVATVLLFILEGGLFRNMVDAVFFFSWRLSCRLEHLR